MTNYQTFPIRELQSFEYHHDCEKSCRQNFFRAATFGGRSGRRNGALPTAVTGAERESAEAGAVVQILNAVPRVCGDVNVEGLARGAA